MPPTDPRRAVIQAVLASPLDFLRARSPGREWVEGGYRAAWDRVRRYFPASIYYVEPGTYFMTHGFGPDGRLFMEIHDSAYLSLSVENRRTFTDSSIVAEYGRMLNAAGGGEAAAFQEKTGRLEFYFRDEPSKKRLRDILGEALYSRLLGGLRQENTHMIAGGLMHEGIHAGMDGEELVARIQAEFKGGGLAVQWDELRAFMAEAAFHGSFYRWAANDIAAGGDEIKARLEMLETLRKRPRLVGSPDREKFERTTAGIGAATALARLWMRELWQSAQRMQGLVVDFQKNYLKPDPPPEMNDLITKARRHDRRLRRRRRRKHPADRARAPAPRGGPGAVGRMGGRPSPLPSAGDGLKGYIGEDRTDDLAGASLGRRRSPQEDGGTGARPGPGIPPLRKRPVRPELRAVPRRHFPLLSFRYIGDTLGYDRCRHVSEVINDLRVTHPGVGVHPVPGPPGDDLPGRR